MITVWTVSGRELATLSSSDIGNVRVLKLRLQELCGQPRFRQRILHNEAILDDTAELVAPIHVQLVILGFANVPPERDDGLYDACRQGDVSQVEQVLQRPHNPNVASADGMFPTPLCAAADSGDIAVLSLLLEAHADPNSRLHEGVDVVILAILQGHMEAARLLLPADEREAVVSFVDRGSLRPLLPLPDAMLVNGDVRWHALWRFHRKCAEVCLRLSAGCFFVLFCALTLLKTSLFKRKAFASRVRRAMVRVLAGALVGFGVNHSSAALVQVVYIVLNWPPT